MPNSLTHTLLNRAGSSTAGASTTSRVSANFEIDGRPLLSELVKAHGGHSDFMGSFVRGFASENAKNASRLTLLTPPNSPTGRVLLYVCPECGDIGCGAYSVRIQSAGSQVVWAEFAYENGYEEPQPISNVGPFTFEQAQYEGAINAASAP